VADVALVLFTANGPGDFGVEIESELDDETLATLLRTAADQIEGKDDRARGAWGR